MSKYTITIEGDFEKYDCNKCPLGILSVSGFVCVMDGGISCPLEEVKQTVPLSEVYRLIAGHSNYRGDSILAALTCVAEGKEVKPIRPLEDVPDTNVGEKGKWIRKIDDDWFRWVECSLCGTKRFAPRDFCPNCGADMRGGKE